MHKRIFSLVVLLTMLVSVFVPQWSSAQSQSEVPEFGTDAFEAYMEQFDGQVEAVNNASPEVFVTGMYFSGAEVYAPGQEVKGSFALANNGGADAPEVYYSISILDGYSATTSNYSFVYGETKGEGPLYIAKSASKPVSFSYKVPNFSPSGVTMLRVAAYSSSGELFGWDEKQINLVSTPAKTVSSDFPRISLEGKLFGLQEGPNVVGNEIAQLVLTVTNTTDVSVDFTPKLSMHDKHTSLKELLAKEYPTETLLPKESKKLVYDLPNFNYVPGVYAGRMTFVNDQGVEVIPPASFRYIMSSDFAAISSVSIDKQEAVKGEPVSVTVVYSGPSVSVNMPPSEQDEAKGVMTVTLHNKKGDVVGTVEKEVDVRTGETYVETLGITADKSASELSATVEIKRNGRVLVSYSTNLSDQKDKEKSSLLLWGISIGLLVLLVATYAWMRRRSAAGVLLVLLFASGLAFISPLQADASASLTFGSPKNNVILSPGEEFSAKVTYRYTSCSNVTGNLSVYLKFEGVRSSTASASINGAGSATASKKFNAPMTPGRYKVHAYGNWNDTAHGTSGSNHDWVWIEVVDSISNGSCGPADGVTTNKEPSEDLCLVGTPSEVTTGANSYSWSCVGAGGGTTATCSAPRPVAGVCGATNNACTVGTLSDTVDSANKYLWSCLGLNGGANANCSLNKPAVTNTLNVQSNVSGTAITSSASGLSGSTNYSKTSSSDINTTLTAPATASGGRAFVSWTGCDSTNAASRTCTVSITGGATQTVTANYAGAPVNGSCGATNNACTTGTLSDTADSSSNYLWSCLGANGGTTATCSLNKPQVSMSCGAYPYRYNGTYNSADGVFDGINESIPADASITWFEDVQGVKADGTTWRYAPSIGFPSAANIPYWIYTYWSGQTGGASNVPGVKTNSVTVSLVDKVTGVSLPDMRDTCSVTVIPEAACGTADGVSASSFPSSNLCSSGSVTDQQTQTSNYLWKCSVNGSVAQCSAPRRAATSNTLNVQSTGASNVSISSSASGFGGSTNYSKSSDSSISTVLTAPNLSGYDFVSWTGCDSTNTASRTCTVSVSGGSSQTVTADYDPDNGGQCTASLELDYSLNPSIVDTPTTRCPLTWEAGYSSTEEGKSCKAATCTLNGAAVSASGSQNVLPGTYTLSCSTGTETQTKTFQCKVNPNYGEF